MADASTRGTVSHSSHVGSSGRCAPRWRKYRASENTGGGDFGASTFASSDEPGSPPPPPRRIHLYVSLHVPPVNLKSPPLAISVAAFHRSSWYANARMARLHAASDASASGPTPSSSSPPESRRMMSASSSAAKDPSPSRLARADAAASSGGRRYALPTGSTPSGCGLIAPRRRLWPAAWGAFAREKSASGARRVPVDHIFSRLMGSFWHRPVHRVPPRQRRAARRSHRDRIIFGGPPAVSHTPIREPERGARSSPTPLANEDPN